MRATTYPPAIRNYLKLVPAATIYLYLVVAHPWMLYNMLNHAKERVERLYFKRNGFQKSATKRDDILRWYYKPALDSQPTDWESNIRQLIVYK